MGDRTVNPPAQPARSFHMGDVHLGGQLEIDPKHLAEWLALSARIMAQQQAKKLDEKTEQVEQETARRL